MITRRKQGETLKSIADAFGVTRERVRQILERHGIKGRYRQLPTAEELLALAQSAFTLSDLSSAAELTDGQLAIAIEQPQLRAAISAILEANRLARSERRRFDTREKYAARLRHIAALVRRTPTQDDLREHGIFHAQLAQVFGNASVAMEAAGLTANRRGQPPAELPLDFIPDDTPTDDPDLVIERANRLLLSDAVDTAPHGNLSPAKRRAQMTVFQRDPRVVAWVLRNAGGKCEACGALGYETDRGLLFLEVHHVIPLDRGGADTIDNAVAVCETCHGKFHRWVGRDQMRDELTRRIPRLSAAMERTKT